MSTDVDICNLALAHLGDDATITSIDPPEGSSQAEHAARFYPIARDVLLELHDWKFASKRIDGAEVESESTTWQFAYSQPADCIKVRAVLPQDAENDYFTPVGTSTPWSTPPIPATQEQPQEFAMESLEDGTVVVYTNQEAAKIRFTKRITDVAKFTPLFQGALARLLASYLAGPVLKGEVGRAEAKEQFKFFQGIMMQATTSDANQQQIRPNRVPSSIQSRS